MNILDYLDWRGDLSFASSAPNEVDALIFAWLVYYHFEELEGEKLDGLTIRELAALHERVHGPFLEVNVALTIDPGVTGAWLLYRASRTERFAPVRVCDFRQTADAGRGIQFAAVSFLIDTGEKESSAASPAPVSERQGKETGLRVIAYRGTDDSIAGWKEDFCMAFSDAVPAQALALDYLENTADGRGALICGHSKGGNLAMYAALFAGESRRKNIRSVYNFDGPGFCFPIREAKNYEQIRNRLVTIVPESSVVGMLLNHEDDYRIVKSRSAGILQHDAMFWQVMGNHFVCAERRNESSLIADRALQEWIAGMSAEERQEFVNALFAIIEGTGALRTTELPEKIVQNGIKSLLRSPVSRQQKKMVFQVLLNLVRAGNSSLYDSLLHSDAAKEITGQTERGAES